MKSSLIRPALALALAASLAACGGSDKAEFTVAGSVTGVVYDGLVLTNAGVPLKVAPPATAGAAVRFAFPDKLEYGDTYAVTVTANPFAPELRAGRSGRRHLHQQRRHGGPSGEH